MHVKGTHRETIQIYAKCMNMEIFKVYLSKPVFLRGTNNINLFLRRFPSSSKRNVVF